VRRSARFGSFAAPVVLSQSLPACIKAKLLSSILTIASSPECVSGHEKRASWQAALDLNQHLDAAGAKLRIRDANQQRN
jgi:hypothetical protein